MCSGIRDAESLSWRLDLALKGFDYPKLLDDYQRERSAHVRHIINGAMFLGNTIQTRSRFKAMLRNNLVLRPASWVPIFNKLFMWVANRKRPLENGFFGNNRPRLTGHLFPQPLVTRVDGSLVLLDDIIGQGFAIVARQGAIPQLPAEIRALADHLPLRVITFAAAPDTGVVGDQSGALQRWFKRAGADFALVRPDRYVYDAGRSEQLLEILHTFLAALPALEPTEVAA
jgi:3-(3-hydroxy-phenyl)propionate hydroxylase